jgi:hypothetical protein
VLLPPPTPPPVSRSEVYGLFGGRGYPNTNALVCSTVQSNVQLSRRNPERMAPTLAVLTPSAERVLAAGATRLAWFADIRFAPG